MNVLIAPDAFKDSLAAKAVVEAMQRGVLQFSPNANCFHISASDGGEGFLQAVQGYQKNLSEIFVNTVDPFGRPIHVEYVWDASSKTAYIELAKASGIELLFEKERDALQSSTYGTGLQIKDALSKGAEKIYVGIGGSATNDAALGIAHALGYDFLDKESESLPPKGASLSEISFITPPKEDFSRIQFFAINDVLNPLFGPSGAAYTYAAQKGASKEEIVFLDRGLQHLDALVQKSFRLQNAQVPGSGAAGGTAYGLKSFFNAEFISGTSFILGLSNFHDILSEEKIDLILTGEGKIDHQTAFGKWVHGIIQEATPYKVPVMAVCGKLDLDDDGVKSLGLLDARQVYDPSKPVQYSFDHADELVTARTFQLLQANF